MSIFTARVHAFRPSGLPVWLFKNAPGVFVTP